MRGCIHNRQLHGIQTMTARLLSLILLLSAFCAGGAFDAKAADTGGFVDTVSTVGNKVTATGWAGGASPGDRLAGIDIYIGDDAGPNLKFNASPRPDVVEVTGRKDWGDSGWEVEGRLAARLKPGVYAVRVVGHFTISGAVELPPSTPAAREVRVPEPPPLDYVFWGLVAAVVACAVWGWLRPGAPAMKVAGGLLAAAVFCGLAWRQHHMVDKYAVNVMYLDQWDFYAPMFKEQNLWKVFDRQEGPTRWGAGMVVTEALAKLSGWNARWDAFGVSFLVMGAAALGLLVARRCGVRAGVAWVAVPLVFLNVRQYESYIGTAILGHGAMPVFLLMGYCLAWFIPDRAWRLGTLCTLVFLLIFTGFGLFTGLIAPLVLMVELLQAMKAKDRAKERRHAWQVAAALGAVVVSWLVFFHGYKIEPVAPGFKFPWDKPVQYFYFMALMVANFHGIAGHGVAVIAAGLCMVAGLAAICGWNAMEIVRGGVENRRRNVVLFSLAAFSLVYMANASVGRICLGLYGASAASRYVTLGTVAGFAFFLQLASVRPAASARAARLAGLLGAAYALALAAGTLSLRQDDWTNVNWFHNGRLAWKEACLKTGDPVAANQSTSFSIYPRPEAIKGRLEYLREHRLNLFEDAGD